MMNNTKVLLELNLDTLTMLINGLYITYNQTHVDAIPSSMFLELAEKLVHFLNRWNYNALSFEQWLKSYLVILPKELFPESEYMYAKTHNQIFIERMMGNATLICTAPIPENVLNEVV